MRAWAVVVAAGRGARSGLTGNKVFYPLAGRSVLFRSLDTLSASGCFEGIVLVISKEDEKAYRELAAREGECPLVKNIVFGGDTRQQSVMNGLSVIDEAVEIVAVHDAARPFATPALIRAVVTSACAHGSGVAATKLVDTVKQLNEKGQSVDTPDRDSLRQVQTPQVFRRAELCDAYKRAEEEKFQATDDASLIERYAGPVRLVEHPDGERNRKLTNAEDFLMAELRTGGAPRIGSGFDVHRLVENRRLILCGVEIPGGLGLLGHSDADVAVHALIDALLGAAALGDIGRHFPDNDPAYKDISSMKLLNEVVSLLWDKGYSVWNADVTIIAQRPKLAPYMDEMKKSLARALRVPEDRVNVKATTTEKLGFEGRGEGMTAMASVMIR